MSGISFSRSALALLVTLAAACSASPTPGPASTTASGTPIVPTATPTAEATPIATGAPIVLPTSGEWTAISPAGRTPAAREAHSWTVDSASGAAYLFGGRDGGTVFDDLWRYETAADRWERLRPSGGAPKARFGHSAVWVAGRGLVVFAGQSQTGFFSDLWLYDPSKNSWSRLPAGGSRPIPRYGSCAVLGSDGRLWVSHGFTEDRVRFADTWAYTFVTGEWSEETPVAGDLPIARCLHACFAAADGRFVLYGGQTTGVAALGDLWVLGAGAQPGQARWSSIFVDDPPLPARNLTALAVLDGTVIAYGGGSLVRGYLDDTWAFSREDLAVGSIDTPANRPAPRSGASLVADAASGRLLLFGGRGPDGAFGDLWSLELH